MPDAVALIPIHPTHAGLGTKPQHDAMLQGKRVLTRVIDRCLRVTRVKKVVLVHDAGRTGDSVDAAVRECCEPKRVQVVACAEGWEDPWAARRIGARRWSAAAWRGQIGGMSIFDELLPLEPLRVGLREAKAASALLVGPDWPLVDPASCDAVLERHLPEPTAMGMVFTQAPPGLCGCAVHESVLEQLDKPGATFAELLTYMPRRPQLDPIGRDVCVQVPAAVRGCVHRFVYDLPSSRAMIDRIAGEVDDLDALDAVALASHMRDKPGMAAEEPRDVTLELTPQRLATGPIVPQHHVDLARSDMDSERAMALVRELGASGEVLLTLGGLGDALLHPQWQGIVRAAKDAGVFAVQVQTDLLHEPFDADALLDAGIDVLSVRLNADSAAVYREQMGLDAYDTVLKRLEALLNARNARARDGKGAFGVPWVLPHLVKTVETMGEMEGFFDRWIHFAGHAVIEGPTTGLTREGKPLMPAMSPVKMTPPRRTACVQLRTRMTVLSDGTVARCDQDWRGEAALNGATLREAWAAQQALAAKHAAGRWDELPMCAGCGEWHRP